MMFIKCIPRYTHIHINTDRNLLIFILKYNIWSICLFLWQYYAVFITVDAYNSPKSGKCIPLGLFFLKIVLAIQGLLCFHVIFSSSFLFFKLLIFYWRIIALQNFVVFCQTSHESAISSVQFSSVAQSCPTLCDPMNHSTPGLPVHHQLPEFTYIHIHRVSDAIQPSHPLSSLSPPAPNPSEHQSLFQGVNSSHEVAKGLEFQL